MSELFTLTHNNKSTTYFYAAFTTEFNRITASAVCLFSMEQIMESFHGNYKSKSLTRLANEHKSQNKHFNDESHDAIPTPRPSECPQKLTYHHLIFSRKNILMENDIRSEALIIESTESMRFTSIDVDFQVNSRGNSKQASDVLFVGTDNGKVLKFVVQSDRENLTKSKLVFSEKLNILEENSTSEKEIMNLKVFEKSHLIMITQNKVLSVPIDHFCSNMSKATCNNQANPYCDWSETKCFYYRNIKNSAPTLVKKMIQKGDLNDSTNLLPTFLSNKTQTIQMLYSKKLQNDETINGKLYKVKNNEITISMNLILFLTLIFTFFILS